MCSALAVAIIVATAQGGCARQRPFDLMRVQNTAGLHVLDFQPIRQKEAYDCGEGAMASVLAYWKLPTSPEDILRDIFAKTPSITGTTAADLKAYAERRGLRAFLLRLKREDICRQIDKGRPVIVCRKVIGGMNHYEVAVGFDERNRRMILADPAKGPYSVPYDIFEKRRKKVDNFALLVAPEEGTPQRGK